MAVAGSIFALNWLEGSLAADCENVEKEVVTVAWWGLPGRTGNVDVAFSRLGERAVIVSRKTGDWMSLGVTAVFDADEVFWA